MEYTIPEKARQRLELLEESERLATSLRDFMLICVPDLHRGDDEDIISFAEHFAAAMTRLRELSARVTMLSDADCIAPETEPQCEKLRLSIRSSLDIVELKYKQAYKVIEERRDRSHRRLIEARKKQNISAYLQTSHIGKKSYHYERLK